MKAVKAENGYPLINPFTKEKTYIKANEIFHALCEQAWKTGEPGIIFIDTINKTNPVPEFGRIEGTNPCGEQPLLFWESCNLGSINLAKFVVNGKVDWNRLGTVTEIATRFLDDVIDVNRYPNVKIARKTRMTRKIGLGVMGWADMLIDLGIRYDSDEALSLAKRVMRAISEDSYRISKEVGKEKGYCLDRLKRRNSVTTTIAPTGTLSLLAGCSSSIEPIFAKEYTKTVMDGVKLDLSKHKDVSDDILVTAHEISIEKHIAMQSAFQEFVDNAVSKTINLPKTAKVATVAKAFIDAHSQGCKGITVYREGSREGPMEITKDKQLSECSGDKCSF
jgi:ribonucleoside-diphosphate reductase alpha chain